MACAPTTLTATDVKHYAYCPVIIYIKHVLGVRESETEYMQMGKQQHEEKIIAPIIAKYRPSRVMRSPQLTCIKEFLSGAPDYLLVAEHGYAVVAEVKWAEPARRGVKRDHKLQLGAYAILARCSLGLNVKVGVIYYLRPQPKLYEVPVTESLLREVRRAVKDMKKIIASGAPPAKPPSPRKCADATTGTTAPTPHQPRRRSLEDEHSSLLLFEAGAYHDPPTEA